MGHPPEIEFARPPQYAESTSFSYPLSTEESGIFRRLLRASFECLPQETAPDKWGRIKFMVRGLIYGHWMKPWLTFLDCAPMQPIVHQYPRLYLKVQWPYLNRGFAPTRRLELVREHYLFLLDRFSPPLRDRLLETKFLILARWLIPDLGVFSLRLSHENKFSQEGEMMLGLYQDETERLCTLLSFSITGPSEISIGGLQGNRPHSANDPSNKDFNVVLTRRLHGVRPKNLVLFALRQLAEEWHITRLRAVSNGKHIFEKTLQADYDAFWTESGGVLDRDGMFDLPVTVGVKDLQDVASKKRAMYRRRYQFLDLLGTEIAATLAEPGREPGTIESQRAANDSK